MNTEVKIKNEEVLLIELCRLEFNDEQIMKIRSLTTNITDWDYFSKIVNAHGVAALACYNLEQHQLLKTIPESTVKFFTGALMINLSRNSHITETVREVLRLLNAENIKTVLLKGFALENSVYGNKGLRQMSDADILIDRDECIKARNILIKNGYMSLPSKSFFHKLVIKDAGKHIPSLIKNGTSVEIHNELFGGRKNKLTKLAFKNSYEILIKGEKAYIPQHQLFFLYLLKHLHLHEMNNESQLRLYTDLVAMITKYRDHILTKDLLIYASQVGMSEILASYLKLLMEIWGVSFPMWINDYIDRLHNPDSLNRFIFFLRSPKGNPPLDKPRYYRQIINDIPGIHRKFIYILGDIFPTVSFMKKRYNCNAWKTFLYYPHRLGKIIWLFRK